MRCFAGLDVSLATTTVCVVDERGVVLHEATVATAPTCVTEALISFMPDLVGLETGPMSEWLHDGLAAHGLETVLMETRHVKAALTASLVKTDRRDARGIANLLGLGWFKPIHVKAASARERRVLLAARDTLARRMRDLDDAVLGPCEACCGVSACGPLGCCGNAGATRCAISSPAIRCSPPASSRS